MTKKQVMLDTNALLRFITSDNEENVVHYGCNTYALTKLDFIDCLLVAYANVKGKAIFTFDSELKKHLGHNAYS